MDRRPFLKKTAALFGLGWIGYHGVDEFSFPRPSVPSDEAVRDDAVDQLSPYSKLAEYTTMRGQLVECHMCPHECVLGETDRGLCRTRVVKGGKLRTMAYGNLCAYAIDPIEKKPLYHFMPQTGIVSVAMGGCNLRCPNCQNWQISQANPEDVASIYMTPSELVSSAQDGRVPSIAYTYTEPVVCFEFVKDTAQLAKNAGIKNVLVTAGYINREPLRQLAKVLDAVQLDIKSFDDRLYRSMARGRLDPVLRSLLVLKEEGVWIEVSFLMVTGVTDEPDQVMGFARWVVSNLGADVPLHLLRFFPSHRLTHLSPTPVSVMQRALDSARAAGLRYVYLGNAPGASDTRCPNDQELLIERRGYQITSNKLRNGSCPRCGTKIAGIFAEA